ncbi:TetR family transcriptional regulator [Microbacterium sp. X-17]|uniref:TetR/AcrR family transcriptional regulator n=1 Tax=Microbacterium sp. X-17 TaxID=3144404 RepID=UPI0031F4EA53
MPRVTDAYREARREEIALAALRCIERSGLNETTVADIVRESGLSAGAIYSHFTNKAELARYIVGHFLGMRREEIEAAGRRGELLAPREILRTMLAGFVDAEGFVRPMVPLQFWAASTVDPGLREELDRTVAEIATSISIAVRPWSEARGRTLDDVVRGMMSLAQGYITHVAIFGPRTVDEYLDAAAGVLLEERS